MNDYIFLMHDDALPEPDRGHNWDVYFARLRAAGAFQGGSAIGGGLCVSKRNSPPAITGHLAGYIRVTAADLDRARELVSGNPVYEAGGTVEIRELPRGV